LRMASRAPPLTQGRGRIGHELHNLDAVQPD
jgi:hypothetical protein